MARELRPCGTQAAYSRHIYRGEIPCRACRDAHAQDAADRRAVAVAKGRPPVHGLSGYVNFGCKCGVCREAGREKNAARYAAP